MVLRRGGGSLSNGGGRTPDLREVIRANRGGQSIGSGSAATDTEQGNGSTVLLWLLLIAVGGAAIAAPKVASVTVRRSRWRHAGSIDSAILAAWAEVLDAATDVDLRPLPTETPRDLAERIPTRGGLSPTRAAQLRQLAHWVEFLRYRGSADPALTVGQIRQLAGDVRGDLYAAISPRDRRRATWWPTSGRLALADGWNQAAEWLADRWQHWRTPKSRQEAPTG